MKQGSISAKILKAMSIFSGVQALSLLCSVVRTKLISTWIGPLGVGLFAVFNTVLEMVSSTTQLNMRETAVRDISASSAQDLPKTASVVRWWALRLGFMGMVIMLLLSPVFSYINFEGDTSFWWCFAVLSVSVVALAVTSGEQALMQGCGDLGLLAKSTIVAVVGATVLSIPLYYWLGTQSIVPSIIIFAVGGMIGVMIYRRQESIKNTWRENVKKGCSFLKLGVYLTVSSLVVTVCQYAFISWLGNVSSTATVGIYQAGYTLVIKYVSIIFSALSLEYFPRLINVAKRRSMASVVASHELSVILAVICPVVVVFIVADELAVRLLYSTKFLDTLPFVTIGICGTVFRAISYCMSYVMVARGDGKAFVITDIMSAVIGLTLNIVMYNKWGFAGLGISYVIWYAIYTVIVGVVYYARYHMWLTKGVVLLSVATILIVLVALLVKYLWGWLPAAMPLVPALWLTWKVLGPSKR